MYIYIYKYNNKNIFYNIKNKYIYIKEYHLEFMCNLKHHKLSN